MIRDLFFASVLLTVFFWFFFSNNTRSEIILRNWADREGFEILKHERLIFGGGFCIFTTSSMQTVFSITVRDRNGRELSGWVRCGTFFGGIFASEKVAVKWKK